MALIFSKLFQCLAIYFILCKVTAKISKHPIILVVSYDGFRYDYLDKGLTPELLQLKANGVSVRYMVSAFPTKTFPNHQSICTGMHTQTHGVVDNILFDPKYNKMLSGYSAPVPDPGFWNYNPDVLPVWILNENAGNGRVSGVYMWPGSQEPYGKNNDSLPTYFYPGYNGSVPWEDRVDTVISWITNDTKPANLVFLYYDEPDTLEHVYGPNSNETLVQIAAGNSRTVYLVKKLKEANIFEQVNLIMLSDHGFAAVTKSRVINMTALIDPGDVSLYFGVSPILHMIAAEGREDLLLEKLLKKTHLGFQIWKKEEIRYRYRYAESRRIQPIVAVANTGYAFDDFFATIDGYIRKYNLTDGDTREYGLHGYSNEDPEMWAYFIAHGPAFKKGYEFEPIHNVDVVPLISKILKLPHRTNNGNLARVIEMLAPKEPGLVNYPEWCS